ncbi:hypothetical protein MKW94_019193 [Papaver nudicaule]|uniref:SKP1-like protein n=1 Tax=Papaver nudicaule TaxID=74823 RepID=A0AA41S4G4_PAPNU|nr:hypothetical protein [Papaver nudicaule]
MDAASSSSTPKSLDKKMKNLKVTDETTKPDKSKSGSGEKSEMRKMITLKSADNKTFTVEKSIVMISETIKHLVEDDCAENVIPLANVTGNVLEKVIVFLKKHAPAMEYLEGPEETTEEEDQKVIDGLTKFDEEFIKGLKTDQELFDLIFAGNYLAIRNLMELTCQTVAEKMRTMSPEKVKDYLMIENDYTPDAD